jgi:hypothetical protein
VAAPDQNEPESVFQPTKEEMIEALKEKKQYEGIA